MRLLIPLVLSLSACATSFQREPMLVAEGGAFTFALTPEQCTELSSERRTYRATEKTATYLSGLGAVLAGVLIPLTDSDTGPAVATGASLVGGGVAVFSGSQVTDLDEELRVGGCPR